VRTDPRKARALELYASHEPKARIVAMLEREFARPPARSTVRRWLQNAEHFDRQP
jgi:hypothetical protein